MTQVKVSVVVPVYNPGDYIERCINSLLRQTLSPDDFEVIFVDDGATDDSPQRLDRLAAEHSHVRVVHQENSGWPGQPRNVGIDLAKGEYVQFLDQDDELGREALERLYAMAARNGSDIVLGKVWGGMGGLHDVYRHNVERCTVATAPLMNTLTPHKMFRRAFLDDHGLRFPEGKRRLEDQLFVVGAYLAADPVSILGDYPCYHWKRREDGGNASKERPEPRGYYRNLRQVIDLVLAATEPGEFRTALMRRWYQSEILLSVSEPRVLRYDDAFRDELFSEVRSIALECFAPEVPASLPPLSRLRADLLADGRLDYLVTLADRIDKLQVAVRLQKLEWHGGSLHAAVRVEIAHDDGSALLVGRESRYYLDPALTEGVAEADRLDVTDHLDAVVVDATLRERDTLVRWWADSTTRPSPEPVNSDDGTTRYRLVFPTTIELDPLALAGGRPLERGLWDVWLHLDAFGFRRTRRLGADRDPTTEGSCVPALLGQTQQVVIPYWTDQHGNLTLDVDEKLKSLPTEVSRRGLLDARITRGRLTARLPVVTSTGTAGRPIELVLGAGEHQRWLRGRIVPESGGAVLLVGRRTIRRATSGLPRASYRLAVRPSAGGQPPPLATVVVAFGRLVGVALGSGPVRSLLRLRQAVTALRRVRSRVGRHGQP